MWGLEVGRCHVLLAWGSAEQGGLADLDVVSLGNLQPALLFARTTWSGQPRFSLQREAPLGTVSKQQGERFVLLQPKEMVPEELAGRPEVMFIHYIFTRLQVKIISQEEKAVFMPCPSPETR